MNQVACRSVTQEVLHRRRCPAAAEVNMNAVDDEIIVRDRTDPVVTAAETAVLAQNGTW